MPVTDPARLPGAFLFFRIVTASGSSFAGVAYDENITSKTKLQDLQQKYLASGGAALPYMERFSPIAADGSSPWQGKDSVTYGGIFGGPDPTPPTPAPNAPPNTTPAQSHLHRSPLSQSWPYSTVENSPIRHGVYVSYWNFASTTSKGMHTSSIHRHFTKGAEVPYMSLWPGNKTNLVPTNATLVRGLLKEVYLDWYATFEADLGWSAETIPTSLGK